MLGPHGDDAAGGIDVEPFEIDPRSVSIECLRRKDESVYVHLSANVLRIVGIGYRSARQTFDVLGQSEVAGALQHDERSPAGQQWDPEGRQAKQDDGGDRGDAGHSR